MNWSLRRHLLVSSIVSVSVGVPIVVYEALNHGAHVKALVLVVMFVAVLTVLNAISVSRQLEWQKRRKQTKH